MALAAVFVAYVARRGAGPPGLGGRVPRPGRRRRWRFARRGDADRRRHGRHHAGAVGAQLHPVLRRRQEAHHRDLGYERIDVLTGAASPGSSASSSSWPAPPPCTPAGCTSSRPPTPRRRWRPWPGDLAGTPLRASGLIGAALLAAAILPLSTAYSICDFTGSEAALDSTLLARPGSSTSATSPSPTVAASWCSCRSAAGPAAGRPPRCSTPSSWCRCSSSCTCCRVTADDGRPRGQSRPLAAAQAVVVALVCGCVVLILLQVA